MKMELKKEGNKKYLYVRGAGVDDAEFRIQMLLNNNIKGLLPVKINTLNNEKVLVYDVTSLSNIRNTFDRKRMNGDDLINITKALKNIGEELHKYFLDIDELYISSEYVFYNKNLREYMFCYIPVKGEDLIIKLKDFYSQLLDFVDYNDTRAVEVAYGMQRITSEDDFSIEDIFRFGWEFKYDKSYEENEDKELDSCIGCESIVEDSYAESQMEVEGGKEKNISFLKKIYNKLFRKKEVFKNEEDLDSMFEMNSLGKDEIEMEEYKASEQDGEIYSMESPNYTEDLRREECFYDIDDDATTLLVAENTFENIALRSVEKERKEVIVVNRTPYKIGKSKNKNDYVLDEETVSREHIIITRERGEFYLEDLKSTNHTYKNDVRLIPNVKEKIVKGDIIKIAGIEFEVM